MPLTTRPNAAPPWPSSNRLPPKSSDGWSSRQMKKSERALSAAAVARHRDGAGDVLQAGDAGPLERDRGETSAPASGLMPPWMISIAGLSAGRRVVVGPGGAVKAAAVVEPAVHVFQEVRRGDRRALRVHRDIDGAERGLDAHQDFAVRGRLRGRRREEAGGKRRQQPDVCHPARRLPNPGRCRARLQACLGGAAEAAPYIST